MLDGIFQVYPITKSFSQFLIEPSESVLQERFIAASGDPGFAVYGIYEEALPSGKEIAAVFTLAVPDVSVDDCMIAILDVVNTGEDRVINSKVITRKDFDVDHQFKFFAVHFIMPYHGRVEFRVFYPGLNTRLTIGNIAAIDPHKISYTTSKHLLSFTDMLMQSEHLTPGHPASNGWSTTCYGAIYGDITEKSGRVALQTKTSNADDLIFFSRPCMGIQKIEFNQVKGVGQFGLMWRASVAKDAPFVWLENAHLYFREVAGQPPREKDLTSKGTARQSKMILNAEAITITVKASYGDVTKEYTVTMPTAGGLIGLAAKNSNATGVLVIE